MTSWGRGVNQLSASYDNKIHGKTTLITLSPCFGRADRVRAKLEPSDFTMLDILYPFCLESFGEDQITLFASELPFTDIQTGIQYFGHLVQFASKR